MQLFTLILILFLVLIKHNLLRRYSISKALPYLWSKSTRNAPENAKLVPIDPSHREKSNGAEIGKKLQYHSPGERKSSLVMGLR